MHNCLLISAATMLHARKVLLITMVMCLHTQRGLVIIVAISQRWHAGMDNIAVVFLHTRNVRVIFVVVIAHKRCFWSST